jgi:tetratricopeptide (TPR) repeat protein
MVDRHYDDEALISLLEAAHIDPMEKDPHLRVCGECRETLGVLRSLSVTMKDDAVWDRPEPGVDLPVAQTIVTLRVFADGMAHEDSIAEGVLREVLAADRTTWAARLQSRPQHRTAGMVRLLLAAADRAIDTMPPDALVLTALATDIAEGLDADCYPSDTVAKLRGAAWRDRAYALYYTGSFTEAEKAVFVAESHLSDCVVGEWDRARISVVQGLVYRAEGRFTDATRVVERAIDSVAVFEDERRLDSLRSLAGSLLFSRGDYAGALSAWSELLRSRRTTESADAYARNASNVASCYREMGKFDLAIHHYQAAAAAWSETGNVSEAVRVRYNVAVTLFAAGDRTAAAQLANVRREFEALAMRSEAALCSLYCAEAAMIDGRVDDVVPFCQDAIREFERSGLAYGTKAMTAIALIKEAAHQRVATPQLVRQVREYVRQLPQQPQLLFMPPPL